MEDLLELAVVFLIFIFGAAAKSSKKKKKKAADKPAPAKVIEAAAEPLESSIEPPKPAEPVKPIEPAKPAAEPAKALSRQNLESAIAAFSELLELDEEAPKPKKKAKKKKVPSGESPVDEHGCIGGSMPAHEAEGESLKEHAGHERRRQERLKEEAPAPRTEILRKPTPADLRKAVVMSEILDKPVSLRRRRI